MKRFLSVLLVAAVLSVSFATAGITLAEEAEETLTIENCEELAAILALKDEFDESIAVFAEKYSSRLIEFDGNIAYLSPHGSEKTRYDLLIYGGDYSETTISGPSFQFSDVNAQDMGVSDLDLPDFVHIGSNIHIIARVKQFREAQGLFILDPVLIAPRETSNAVPEDVDGEAAMVAETAEKRAPGACPWDFEQMARAKGYSEANLEAGIQAIMESQRGVLMAKGFLPEKADEIVEKARRGEPLTPFQMPDYDVYNSPASKNGREGDLLLLTGVVKKYVKDGTNSQYVICIRLEQEDGREWMVSCAQYANKNLIGERPGGTKGQTVFDGLEGKTVEIYGKYLGLSDQYHLPAVDITRYGGLYLPEEDRFIYTYTSRRTMSQKGMGDLAYLIGAQRTTQSVEKYRP